ncbi:MAG: DUF4112 domain-containing protein [Balneolaceae bacterium]|nr:DUF4112 domain-containing protein [Balneolaceae bacterium]
MHSTDEKNRSRQLAELLDNRFTIPSTRIRFGIDPVIGLVPGIGDWIGGAISIYYLVMVGIKGGKASVLGRVFLNILLDVLIGSIPVLGEIFDVYWKANIRNAKILQELEENPAKTTSESRFWIWMVLIQCIAVIIALLLLFVWLIAELFDLIF